jgi:FMN phosphatase YigB (HAD superfamily)
MWIFNKSRVIQPLDWERYETVVFDVDGTLYDQTRLRAHMAQMIALHCWHTRSISVAVALREFRRHRERLGTNGSCDLRKEQYKLPTPVAGFDEDSLRSLVEEWIERKPLPILSRYIYPGVDSVFSSLRRHGKTICVFSDYPAAAKLRALGLDADLIVSSIDKDVDRLKPNPAGLLHILRKTRTAPDACLMIGDRRERDGLAAQRAGVPALLRSSRHQRGYRTFRDFRDALFTPLFQ